jgi:hypothetical protein
MKIVSICKDGILLIPFVWVNGANGHGIAGNRYFDGTLTFDDPAVADEAIVPNHANANFPMQGSSVSENRIILWRAGGRTEADPEEPVEPRGFCSI